MVNSMATIKRIVKVFINNRMHHTQRKHKNKKSSQLSQRKAKQRIKGTSRMKQSSKMVAMNTNISLINLYI